jgi:cytochrome c oxidase subunit 3
MSTQPIFTGDLASLPTHGFGPKSTTWWGVIAFFLIEGTFFVSEIPNSMVKRAAERGRLRDVRRLLVIMALIATALLVIRGFEFASLNVLWYDNAYGSIVWTLLFLHATHIVTDWGDTLVLTALMHGRHGMEGRRFVDVSENALYWRFVWLAWLPIYLMIYWLPRWVS